MDTLGKISFIFGVVVSIIAGFMTHQWIYAILTVLGLLVGLLNISAKEVQTFLLAAVSLVIISALGADQIAGLPVVGLRLGKIYMALLTFVSPAAIIVALRSLYHRAKK
ncbi:hypothetical protein JXB12_01425 [candidate division KSB1 bacterium]|nr:hypothetical protein [candidate division KSB1 bacterium]